MTALNRCHVFFVENDVASHVSLYEFVCLGEIIPPEPVGAFHGSLQKGDGKHFDIVPESYASAPTSLPSLRNGPSSSVKVLHDGLVVS